MADGNGQNPSQQQSQEQHQSQATALTINFRGSGDPALENQILNGDYGVGRQLGTLAGVVAVLLAAHEQALAPEDAAVAIAKFKKAQADIARVKRLRKAARTLEKLERPSVTPAAARVLCGELRTWLDAYERDLAEPASDGPLPASLSGSPAAS